MNINLNNIPGYVEQAEKNPLILSSRDTKSNAYSKKQNHSNVNFRSLQPVFSAPVKNYKHIAQLFKKFVGTNLEEIIDDLASSRPDLLRISSGGLIHRETSVLTNVIDSVLYPVRQMPYQLTDFLVSTLRKIPFLKESKTLSRIYDSELLTKKRLAVTQEENLNSIKGIIDFVSKYGKNAKDKAPLSEELFMRSLKSFDEKIGNYNTVLERSSNRIVSGLPPALIYLANDAHNVYMESKNDKKGAEKEKTLRRNQELTRLGITGYLQLVTLGAFAKFVNKSPLATVACILAPVFISETFSRVLNNKPIKFLSKEEAKEFNRKTDYKKPETQKKTEFEKKIISEGNIFESFHNGSSSKEKRVGAGKSNSSMLSWNNFFKVVAGLALGGFAIGMTLKQNTVAKLFGKISAKLNKFYKSLTKETYKIKIEDMENIIHTLKSNGFDVLASKYESLIAKSLRDSSCDFKCINGVYHLGEITKSTAPLVNFFLAPFKFALGIVKAPYKFTSNFINLLGGVATPKPPKHIKDADDLELLTNSVKKLHADLKNNKIKSQSQYLNAHLLNSFNMVSKSSQANNELSVLVSFLSRLATSYFLVVDDHGVVMRSSDGENEEQAWVKSKDRILQRGASMLSSLLFIDLFNKTFARTYNSSIAGASLVTLAVTFVVESFTRWSIGMPSRACSKEELDRIRQEHESRTDFLGKYFRFMSRVTGRAGAKNIDAA